MIPLDRVAISAHAQGLLTVWTQRVAEDGATAAAARERWSTASAPKKHVRTSLESMARGALRCMYCDDSRGTDIDHFEPLDRAPLRAFVWLNHLLACSFCNSNAKRHQYPVSAQGDCLLVDPTAEDPSSHLRLMLTAGTYDPLSPKGEHTIRVFGLNRADLVEGRRNAFVRARSNLRDWHSLCQDSDPEADRVAQALLDSPFIDVVHAMTQLEPRVAANVVGQSTLPALDAWRALHSLSFHVEQLPAQPGASYGGNAPGTAEQNYGLTWTDPIGIPRASAVAYDERSAHDRKSALESDRCTSVEIVPLSAGNSPTPGAEEQPSTSSQVSATDRLLITGGNRTVSSTLIACSRDCRRTAPTPAPAPPDLPRRAPGRPGMTYAGARRRANGTEGNTQSNDCRRIGRRGTRL